MADSPVLILGAGVHGGAIARELLLNGVPVCLVDTADIAYGATAKSSRLIHGGLRYLEYGDVRLVRESLLERQRMLDLAPNFVKPLRLFIPVRTQWTGLVRSAVGFLGGQRAGWGRWFDTGPEPRGYWPTRIGLQMYDWLSGETGLPGSTAVELGAPGTPRVDPQRYIGLLAYSDAQMLHPERFVLALLADAEAIARQEQCPWFLHTWADYRLEPDGGVTIVAPRSGPLHRIHPRLIVNATGAWGDHTRQQLGVLREPLFGGTKGSHLVTFHRGLREALAGQAVYAEADDGRLVFVLPFGEGVLIGTTDETFAASPAEARVTSEEREYLLGMVKQVFNLDLAAEDIALEYSGVRPLPRPEGGPNAAISRDHQVVWEEQHGVPIATLVGGKLTTWRAFAETVSNEVLERMEHPRVADTRGRPIPGNDPAFTPDPALWSLWAEEFRADIAEVAAVFQLFGTRAREVLAFGRNSQRDIVPDSVLSTATVRWIIRHEWVTTLEDLVERRLMAVFAPVLTRAFLEGLAECLVQEDRLRREETAAAVERCESRLREFYGRKLSDVQRAGNQHSVEAEPR